MRLLVANFARGPIGGAENYLRAVCAALAARGHEIALLCEQRLDASAAPFVPAAEWCVAESSVASTLAAARAWRPEALWIHTLHDPALEAALLDLAPAAAFLHNHDGACATGAKMHLWPAPRPCARTMGPACAALNFTRNCGRLHPAAFLSEWSRQRRHAALWPRYRRLLVGSRFMQAEIARAFAAHRRPAVHLRCLGYPLLAERVAAVPPRPRPQGCVLMLARLTAAKGGAVLLQAAVRAQAALGFRLHLVIAGDGPELPRLRALAARLQLDAEFPGWITPAERLRHLAQADVLAVPSLWPEPFGLVGLEAAAQAVPAVAFDLGGIPEWLLPGRTGELAPATPPSAAGLAAALVRALGDPGRWRALRRLAWESSAAHSLDLHLDRLEPLLAGADKEENG